MGPLSVCSGPWVQSSILGRTNVFGGWQCWQAAAGESQTANLGFAAQMVSRTVTNNMQTTQQTDGDRRAAKPTIFTISSRLEAKCEELLLVPGGWQTTGGLGSARVTTVKE